MTTVQDRVHPNRSALDKWSKREQLCLASAVSCSGDQNWMTVSRSLKLLCGSNHPPDWFSQKHCAVKYGELLENVETPKRKKRTISDNAAAPSLAETPTDSILRRLTEERIQELKSEIREQQETYAKLYTDVVHLQTGNSNEEQIRAMWIEIEREQEQDRKARARQQMANQEATRNWRQGQQYSSQQSQQQQQVTTVKQEQDMDIDETCKPQGTSPLLSSLLKSSSPAPTLAVTPTTSTVRVSAPTITNLLTGGISATSSASSILSQTTSFQNVPFTKPLTGPGPSEKAQSSIQSTLSPSQSAPTLSMLLEKNKAQPSTKESTTQQTKTATTQILEEVKSTEVESSSQADAETEATVEEDEPIEEGFTPTKEEEQQLMEVFKNLMPDNIDELADILTNNHAILNPAILEEESILEGVESLMKEAEEAEETEETEEQPETNPDKTELKEEPKNNQTEVKDIPEETEKLEEVKPKVEEIDIQISEQASVPSKDDEDVIMKEEVPSASTSAAAAAATSASASVSASLPPSTDETKSKEDDKIETISSDDSSDNVPLSTHTTSRDSKSQATTEVTEIKDDVQVVVVHDTPTESPTVIDEDEDEEENQTEPERETTLEKTQDETIEQDETTVEVPPNDDETTESIKFDKPPSVDEQRKASLSDSSDVIIIPTDDESNEGKTDENPKKNSSNSTKGTKAETQQNKQSTESIVQKNEIEIETSPEVITSICLPDTDDESTEPPPSTSSVSLKDDKSINKQTGHNKKPETQQTEQRSTTETETETETEIKPTPTALRKLRDRDRSESPLVEEDTSDNSTTQRLRRRYSSTPVIESVPNSPVSGDDRELKVWKKSLMTVYNNLLTNKNASIFLRPIADEQNPLFKKVCRRPMDLQIIKRHIENGTIRNVTDLQRDVFLMCQNVIITFKEKSSYASMAKDLMVEFVQLKDQIVEGKMSLSSSSASSPYTPGVKVRGSSRKSQRLP